MTLYGDWKYNKYMEITNPLPDYQMKVEIDYNVGGSGNIDLNGHCNTDFTDIRFSDYTDTVELPFYLESKIDGSTATFWIKNNASPYIFIYYGNATATSASNGENTFIFFDDFEDGTFNKWNNSGDWITENTTVFQGTFSAFEAGGGLTSLFKTMSTPIDYPIMIHIIARGNNTGITTPIYPIIPQDSVTSICIMAFKDAKIQYNQGVYTDWVGDSSILDDTWYILDVAFPTGFGVSTKIKGWKNNVYLGEIDNKNTAGAWVSSIVSMHIKSGPIHSALYLDQCFVRKYQETNPPTWSSSGNERDLKCYTNVPTGI